MSRDGWIELTAAIRELRRELATAMAAAEGEPLRFELDSVEVEFAMTVRRDGGANATVNFAVATAGVKGDVSAESLHRLKLTLLPKVAETGRVPEVAAWIDAIPPR